MISGDILLSKPGRNFTCFCVWSVVNCRSMDSGLPITSNRCTASEEDFFQSIKRPPLSVAQYNVLGIADSSLCGIISTTLNASIEPLGVVL